MQLNWKVIVIALAGFVIGFDGAWLWLRNSSDDLAAETPLVATTTAASVTSTGLTTGTVSDVKASPTTGTATVSSGSPSLVVSNQQPSGTVIVSSVNASQDVWVVIHDEKAGKPAGVLGAALFRVGTHSGKVILLRGTVTNGSYFAMLHKSNGDKVYSDADLPLLGSNGAVVSVPFTTNNLLQ